MKSNRLLQISKMILFGAVFFGVFSWIPLVSLQLLSFIKIGFFSTLIVIVILKKQFRGLEILPWISLYGLLLLIPYIYSVLTLGPSLLSTIKFCLIPVLMIVVLGLFERVEDACLVVFRGFLLGVFCSAIWIYTSYAFSYNPSLESVSGGLSYLPYSVMGLSNTHTMASPLLGIAGGLILLCGEVIWRGFEKYSLKVAGFCFLLYAQVLTTGEGGILVYIAALFCVFIVSRIGLPVLIPIFSVVGAYLAFNVVGPYLSDSLYASYIEHKIANVAGFQIFIDHPFWGVGFEQSYQHFGGAIASLFYSEHLYSESLTPHNPYGLLMAEAGLFGFIAILLLVGCLLVAFSKVVPSCKMSLASYFVLVFLFLLSILEPWPMVSNFYVSYIFYASLAYLFSRRIINS